MFYKILVNDEEDARTIVSSDNTEADGSINISMSKVDNSFIIEVQSKGYSFESAKILSESYRNIYSKYQDIILLYDEVSIFYGTKLYRKFSEFENKLRAFLRISCYLENAISEDFISNVESVTYSQLYEFLFGDKMFGNELKGRVDFSKPLDVVYIKELFDELDYNPRWSRLCDIEEYPVIYYSHNLIRRYRNMVMHVKYIDTEKYKEIDRLISDAVSELDDLLEEYNTNSPKVDVALEFNNFVADIKSSEEFQNMMKNIFAAAVAQESYREMTAKLMEAYPKIDFSEAYSQINIPQIKMPEINLPAYKFNGN